MLDDVCDRIREMKEQGQTRPDASLGLIENQEVANRLKEAGLECYGHNLRTIEEDDPAGNGNHDDERSGPHQRATQGSHPPGQHLPGGAKPVNLILSQQ